MSLHQFSLWLYDTPESQIIQNTGWVIPTVQSVHIVSIACLIGAAIVLDLKLAGFVARTETALIVFRRYMPWLWSSLGVLVLTGLIMVLGEPERALMNWVFWTKMCLILLAFLLTLVMRVPMLNADLAQAPGFWGPILKPLGIMSLTVWVLVIFCGRWIAYS